MKNVFLFLLLSSLMFMGCDRESETKNLVFHVQSDFEDDMVEIYVDDATLVLSQKATTNHILGVDLNAMKTIEVTTGEHSIRVVVNGTDELRTSVGLVSDLYIGVRYDPRFRSTNRSSLIFTTRQLLLLLPAHGH